jgi:integrase
MHVQDRWTRKVRQPDGTVVTERTERYGKGMRYRARYKQPDGTEGSQGFPDGRKREAEAFAKAQETDVRRGTWQDPDKGKMTLHHFAETVWFPGLPVNATTRERYEYQLRLHIYPKLGTKQLGFLAEHPSVIQQWVTSLKMKPSTAGVVLQVLTGILSSAVKDGMIGRNPCNAVQAPKVIRRKIVPWEADRVALVRAGLIGRYQALTECGAELGMRQGEVFGISPGDIDWLRRVVHIRRQVKIVGRRVVFAPPKGGRERDVPLPGETQLKLSKHIAEFPTVDVTLPWEEPDGKRVTVPLMFTTISHKPLRRGDFDSHHWIPAIEAAGLEKGDGNGFHALRHHFASVLLAEGEDIRSLSEYLGHHDPGFTLRVYTHLMPGNGSRMRQIIDDAARKRTRRISDGPETAQGSTE